MESINKRRVCKEKTISRCVMFAGYVIYLLYWFRHFIYEQLSLCLSRCKKVSFTALCLHVSCKIFRLPI